MRLLGQARSLVGGMRDADSSSQSPGCSPRRSGMSGGPMLRSLCLITLLLTGVSLSVPQVGWAQDLTAERVQTALDRTDERIQLAQSLVADADHAQAELEVSAAVSLQSQAKVAFQQGLGASAEIRLRLFQQAIDLTLRARARADRAISLIQGLPDPERVLSQVERTRELLDRARERIEECNNDRARALLRVALEMQVRAEAAIRDSRYLAALQ